MKLNKTIILTGQAEYNHEMIIMINVASNSYFYQFGHTNYIFRLVMIKTNLDIASFLRNCQVQPEYIPDQQYPRN